jgi:hypothetical protein|eukprot:COSAG01_NODE_11128_length_2000_cov_5.116255_1_plen_70_part_00
MSRLFLSEKLRMETPGQAMPAQGGELGEGGGGSGRGDGRRVLRLADAAYAHQLLESGQTTGKLLLDTTL